MARKRPQFWFKFNNSAETLWLPVDPETISVSSTYGYQDIEITNLGEYTMLGNNRLKEFSLSSFFPRDYNASYCRYMSLKDPWECVKLIEKWQKSGKPLRYIVTGTPINIAVTIRSFEYEERGGEPGDIYFTIQLKEYVFISTKKKSDGNTNSNAGTKPQTSAERPSTVDKAKSYTVKSGDSLFKIAAKPEVYGDGNDWRKLYDKNKLVIGANPNVLKPGQKLVIP